LKRSKAELENLSHIINEKLQQQSMLTEKSGQSVMILDKKQINFDQNQVNTNFGVSKEPTESFKAASQTMPDF
jgi:hypothetical protein